MNLPAPDMKLSWRKQPGIAYQTYKKAACSQAAFLYAFIRAVCKPPPVGKRRRVIHPPQRKHILKIPHCAADMRPGPPQTTPRRGSTAAFRGLCRIAENPLPPLLAAQTPSPGAKAPGPCYFTAPPASLPRRTLRFPAPPRRRARCRCRGCCRSCNSPSACSGRRRWQ